MKGNEHIKIIVCVKVVKSELVFSDAKNHDEYTINPYDLYALEVALQQKDQNSETKIIVLSMGGTATKDALSRCYAMGVDEIIWLCDDWFAGSDTVATTKILAKAIQTIGSVQLILCGGKAVDGETGQVPIGLAERLKIPVMIGVEKLLTINQEGVMITANNARETMEMKLTVPAICAFRSFLTESRRVTLFHIKKSRQMCLKHWNAQTIGINQTDCGLIGSKTKVVNIVFSQVQKDGIVMEGTIKEKVEVIQALLLREGHYDTK